MEVEFELDLRAIQSDLRNRDFLHSSETVSVGRSMYAKSSGYHRIDDHSFLYVLDLRTDQPYHFSLYRPDIVCIRVLLSGLYARSAGDRLDSIDASSVYVTNFPTSSSTAPVGAKVRGLIIACKREHFVDTFKLNVDAVPPMYRPLFTSPLGLSKQMQLRSSPLLSGIADQVVSCRFYEPLRSFYLRAKAVEIICEVVSLINTFSTQPKLVLPSGRRKDQAIEIAAEIYKREFANPPSIEQLASRVGLNRNDLTNGFRELFGDTPRGYSDLVRMNHAKAMLEEGTLSISEVGRRIGYEGYASFARKFAAHFGHPPSRGKR